MEHRHHLSVLVALVFAVLAQIGCQEQARMPDISEADAATAPQKALIAAESPRITFDKTVYDFGEVAAGKKYTGQFTFTNTGTGLLKIAEVKKCCGAVVALDQQELAPREKGVLKVEYNAGQVSGQTVRELRVFSNDPTNATAVLTIKAKVAIRVDYQPKRIDLLPKKENAGCPPITITSLDKQPFSITAFQSIGEVLTAEMDPSVEATRFVIQPKVDLEKLGKRSAGYITVSLTHPELDTVTILFAVLQRFKTIPGSVLLVNPRPLEPAIQKVTIISSYSEPFEIESTSSDKGYVKVLSQQAVANGYRLDVEITPPARDATNGFADVLHIRLNDGEKLSIKCSGRYAEMNK